jgi:hypothetical protein
LTPPRISYYDSAQEELKLGSFGAPSWSVRVLDQARSDTMELEWSGESTGIELQTRAAVNTGRWSTLSHGLAGTNYSISTAHPAGFYRLRLE